MVSQLAEAMVSGDVGMVLQEGGRRRLPMVRRIAPVAAFHAHGGGFDKMAPQASIFEGLIAQ